VPGYWLARVTNGVGGFAHAQFVIFVTEATLYSNCHLQLEVPRLFNPEILTSSAYDQFEVDIHYIEDLDTTVFNRHGESHSPEAESIMIIVLYAMTIENATVEFTTFPSPARASCRCLCPTTFYGYQVGQVVL
jgi:hypothetical protein